MNEIAIKLAVLQAPYYSEMELNEKLEEKFIDLQETLLNRTEQNRHKLNPKNVTGIWYLPALTYETGKPHILVRSPLAKVHWSVWKQMMKSSHLSRMMSHTTLMKT